MGDYSYGNIIVVGEGDVVVGKFCSIAPAVVAAFRGGHRTDWVTTYPFPEPQNPWDGFGNEEYYIPAPQNISIGNDVWLGHGVTLLGGSSVGDGAVVGMNAVVAGHVEPYCVAVGNPARVTRRRFTEEQVGQLLELQWWNWEPEKIQAFVPYLCNTDIDRFLEQAKCE